MDNAAVMTGGWFLLERRKSFDTNCRLRRKWRSSSRGQFLSYIEAHLDFGDLNSGSRSFPQLAIDPHAIFLSEQNLEPLIDIAHTDPLLEQRGKPALGNAHAIVFYGEMQPAIAQRAGYANHPAVHFA